MPVSVSKSRVFRVPCDVLPVLCRPISTELLHSKALKNCFQRLQSNQNNLGESASAEPMWYLAQLTSITPVMNNFIITHSESECIIPSLLISCLLFNKLWRVADFPVLSSTLAISQSFIPTQRAKVGSTHDINPPVQCQPLSALLTSAKSEGYLWAVLWRAGASASSEAPYPVSGIVLAANTLAWPGANGTCAYQATMGVSMALSTTHSLQQEFWLGIFLDEDKFFQPHSRDRSRKGQADHVPLMPAKVFVSPLRHFPCFQRTEQHR